MAVPIVRLTAGVAELIATVTAHVQTSSFPLDPCMTLGTPSEAFFVHVFEELVWIGTALATMPSVFAA